MTRQKMAPIPISDLPRELRPRIKSPLVLLQERQPACDESELCETCLGTGIGEHNKNCPDCRGAGLISAW